MPASDLPLLVDAARQASGIALRHWRADPRVEYKAGGSPVSEADLAVDAFLRERLSSARPGYGWLSEETEDDRARLARPSAFVVDPIDGTRAFLDGSATWAISLAVVDGGAPCAGVVYLPARDKFYAAALGEGATLNGAPIRAGAREEPDGATVLAPGRSLDPRYWAEAPPALERHWRPSLAYRFCLVAEGRFDAVLTIMDAHEWDIAAGVLIAREAGAAVTDRDGAPLAFNTGSALAPGVVAAAPVLHARLVSRYAGAAAAGAT